MVTRASRGRLPEGSGLLLVPAAAFCVHQLRYWLAYGSRANAELVAQGHSYLNSLTPWLVLSLGIGLALFLRRVARAVRTGDGGAMTRLSAPALWALSWLGLVALYAVQETLEEYLASGHPTGMAGVFGNGGWWAVPAAALVAVGLVAALRTARAVLRVALRFRRTVRWAPSPPTPRPASASIRRLPPLAVAAAGRAPPISTRFR